MIRRGVALAFALGGTAACGHAPAVGRGPDFDASGDQVFHRPQAIVASPDSELLPTLDLRRGEIAYAGASDGNVDIFIRPLAGGSARRLTTSPTDDTEPAFSPDGRFIAWVSQAEDVKGDIWVMESDGGARRRLTGPETADRAPAWSSDGTAIYFTARAPGRHKERIDALVVKSGARRTLVEDAWDVAASPDGRFLAYVSLDERQRSRIFIQRPSDGARVPLTDGAYVEALPRIAATADGSAVVFVRFVDDANDDGRADAQDVASLWSAPITPEVLAGGPTVASTPLTAGEQGEMFAAVAGTWLAYTTQSDNDLDIYAVPLGGIVASSATAEAVLAAARAEERPSLRRLALRHLIATEPRLAAEARYELGRELAERGKLTDAIAELERSIAASTDEAQRRVVELEMRRLRLLALLGGEWRIRRIEDENGVRDLIRELGTLSVEKGTGVFYRRESLLGELALARGRLTEAARVFERLAGDTGVVAEDGARALDHLAAIYARTGDASAVTRVSLLLHERFAGERYLVGRSAERWVASVRDSDVTAALVGLDALATQARKLPAVGARALAALATEQAAQGFDSQATATRWRIVAEYPGERRTVGEALVALGAGAELRRDSGAALDAYERLLADFADDASLRARGRQGVTRIAIAKAQLEESRGELAQARASYQRLLRADPEQVMAHRRYIALSARTGELDEVLGAYRAAVTERPRDKVLRYAYGYALTFVRPLSIGAAERQVTASLLLDPRLAVAHLTLGWLREQRERDEPAQGWLEAAQGSYDTARDLVEPETDPELYAAALVNRGNVLFALGKNDGAFDAYRERALFAEPFREPLSELLFFESFARAALRQEALDVALDMATQAYRFAERLPGKPRLAAAAALRAGFLLLAGLPGEARAWYERSDELYRAAGDDARRVPMLRGVALAAQASGDYDRALEAWRAVLDILRRDEGPEPPRSPRLANEDPADPNNVTRAIYGFTAAQEDEIAHASATRLLLRRGDIAAARRYDRRRLALLEAEASSARAAPRLHVEILHALHESALLAAHAGDIHEAQDHWTRAIQIAGEQRWWTPLAVCLESLMQARARLHTQVPLAPEIWLAATTALEATASSVPDTSRRIAGLLALAHMAQISPSSERVLGEDPATRLAGRLAELDEAANEAALTRDYAQLALRPDLAGPFAEGAPVASASPSDWRGVFAHAVVAAQRGNALGWKQGLGNALLAYEQAPVPERAPELASFIGLAALDLLENGETERAWRLAERHRLLELQPSEARLAPTRLGADWGKKNAPMLMRAVSAAPVTLAEVAAQLGEDEALLQVHRFADTTVSFFVARATVQAVVLDGHSAERVPQELAAILTRAKESGVRRLYVDLGELRDGPAAKWLLAEKPLEEVFAIDEVLSATYFVAALQARQLTRGGLLVIGGSQALPEALVVPDKLAMPAAVERVLGEQALVYLRLPIRLESSAVETAGRAQLIFGAREPSQGHPLDFDWMARQELQASVLLVDAPLDTARMRRALVQAALLGGVSTVVSNLGAVDAGRLLVRLRERLGTESLDAVLAGVRAEGVALPVAVAGDGKLDFAARVSFAVETYKRLATESIAAFKAAQANPSPVTWHRAQRRFRELLDAMVFLSEPASADVLARSNDTLARSLPATLPRREGAIRSILAQTHLALGETEDAAALQEVLIADHQRQGNGAGVVKTTAELGKTLAHGNEHSRAAEVFDRCSRLAAAAGDVETEADCASRLGTERRALFDYAGAVRAYQKAILAYAKLGSRNELYPRRYLGFLYESGLNNFDKALEQFLAAQAIATRHALSDLEAQLLLDVARIYRQRASYDEAVTYAQRAEVIAAERAPKVRGESALELAKIEWYRGNYRRARTHQASALAVARASADTFLEIQSLSLQGLIALNQGALVEAEHSIEDALSLARRSGRRAEEAAQLNNLGFVRRESGKLALAIEDFRSALTIDEELGSDDGRAYDLRNLGIALARQGDAPQALTQLDQALGLSRKVNSRYNELQTLLAQALIFESLADNRAATTFGATLELARALQVPEVEWSALYGLGRLRAAVDDRSGARLLYGEAIAVAENLGRSRDSEDAEHTRRDLFADAMTLALAEDDVTAAFMLSERARNRRLLDIVGSGSVSMPNAEAARLIEAEARAREALVRAERQAAGQSAGKDTAALSADRARHAQAFKDLVRRYPRLARVFTLDVSATTALQPMLPVGTVVLSYFVGRDGLIAFATGPRVQRAAIAPVSRSHLRKLVGQMVSGIAALAPVDKELQELSELLLVPLRETLTDATRMIVIPDGTLQQVPFAALPLDSGALVDRMEVSSAPSVGLLVDVLSARAAGRPGNVASLAAADDLAYARLEALAVARGSVWLGASATEASLRDVRADAVDIATHAELDADDPLGSALVLRPSGSDDGRLQTREIFGLEHVPPMVVLSACQTAGQPLAADAWVSLASAFLTAGSQSVVASRQRVSDLATAVTVKRFFRHLASSPPSRALRQAMLETRAHFPHPAHWAGLALIGDFR